MANPRKPKGKRGRFGAPATPPALLNRVVKVRLPAAPAAAPAPPAAAPAPLRALTLNTREQIRSVLATAERSLPALRTAGQFGILGLVSQQAHALKLVAEHSHALERALGLEPEAPAPPAGHTSTNGVPGQ
jgi:hypothetical protein